MNISGIYSSLSALQAIGTKTAVTANNTANINTNEFKKSRADLEEVEPQGVKVHIRAVDTPGPQATEQTAGGDQEQVEMSNVEPAEELTNMMLARRYFEANVKTIQIQDEMLGSLIDIKK